MKEQAVPVGLNRQLFDVLSISESERTEFNSRREQLIAKIVEERTTELKKHKSDLQLLTNDLQENFGILKQTIALDCDFGKRLKKLEAGDLTDLPEIVRGVNAERPKPLLQNLRRAQQTIRSEALARAGFVSASLNRFCDLLHEFKNASVLPVTLHDEIIANITEEASIFLTGIDPNPSSDLTDFGTRADEALGRINESIMLVSENVDQEITQISKGEGPLAIPNLGEEIEEDAIVWRNELMQAHTNELNNYFKNDTQGLILRLTLCADQPAETKQALLKTLINKHFWSSVEEALFALVEQELIDEKTFDKLAGTLRTAYKQVAQRVEKLTRVFGFDDAVAQRIARTVDGARLEQQARKFARLKVENPAVSRVVVANPDILQSTYKEFCEYIDRLEHYFDKLSEHPYLWHLNPENCPKSFNTLEGINACHRLLVAAQEDSAKLRQLDFEGAELHVKSLCVAGGICTPEQAEKFALVLIHGFRRDWDLASFSVSQVRANLYSNIGSRADVLVGDLAQTLDALGEKDLVVTWDRNKGNPLFKLCAARISDDAELQMHHINAVLVAAHAVNQRSFAKRLAASTSNKPVDSSSVPRATPSNGGTSGAQELIEATQERPSNTVAVTESPVLVDTKTESEPVVIEKPIEVDNSAEIEKLTNFLKELKTANEELLSAIKPLAQYPPLIRLYEIRDGIFIIHTSDQDVVANLILQKANAEKAFATKSRGKKKDRPKISQEDSIRNKVDRWLERSVYSIYYETLDKIEAAWKKMSVVRQKALELTLLNETEDSHAFENLDKLFEENRSKFKTYKTENLALINLTKQFFKYALVSQFESTILEYSGNVVARARAEVQSLSGNSEAQA